MLPFLAVKTRIPILFPNLVNRPQLLDLMNQCLLPGMQIALVSAIAGAGKTTLLAQWIEQISPRWKTSWITLDSEDNHLTHFFSYLSAAINQSIPELMGGITPLIEANHNYTPEQAVAYLIEQLVDSEQNLLVILDDYHTVVHPEIHRAIKLLIDHLPANLRLVISGRVEPPLPLARLRARAQLVEVHTDDLRFNVQETDLFMRRFPGLEDFSGQEIYLQQLKSSTEGWAAGLQMLALALRNIAASQKGTTSGMMERFIREINGSHRYILDYLMEEVLSNENDKTRRFLLHTCLLTRFNPTLCSIVVPGSTIESAQETLAYLERANLFIFPLDEQQEWYRYHQLFADMLQKQLLHNHPGLAAEIHSQSANWLEAQGMIDEALEHAQSSGKNKLYLDMVEKHALTTILQGKISTATRWLDLLSEEEILTRPRLCLDRAWSLIFTSQTEAAYPYLEYASIRSNKHPATQAEILGLKSFSKSFYGLIQDAVLLAEQALDVSPSDHTFLQCLNHLFLASALVRDGKLEEAMQTYRSIQSTCRTLHQFASLALLESDFLHFAAIFMNARNQGQRAKNLLNDAIQTFEASGDHLKAATLYLWVGLGKILFIENQLADAERVLEIGLQYDPLSLSQASIDGWMTLWWVKIGQGDYTAARHILNDLEPSIRRKDEKIYRLFTLTAALQDLLEGKVTKAIQKMESLSFTDDAVTALANVSDSELFGWRSNEYLVYARILAAQGKTKSSLLVLERMARVTQEHGVYWIMYRTWITQALVYYQIHQIDQTMEIMERLLKQTSKLESGAVRVYLSAGEPTRALLKEAALRNIQPDHVTQLLADFPPEKTTEKNANLPETLTERELEVLKLMSEGLRNEGIGQKLFISLNTVRYHSKNIFGKLGVSSRTAAVTRALELEII